MGCKDRKTSCKKTVKNWKWSTNKPVHVLCYYKAVLLFSGLKPNTPQKTVSVLGPPAPPPARSSSCVVLLQSCSAVFWS